MLDIGAQLTKFKAAALANINHITVKGNHNGTVCFPKTE